MHYLGVFGQHGELHDLLGRLVEDLIPNDDAGSKLEGIRQDIAEFRNAGSRFVRKRSEGSLGPGGEPVEYKINQESADERNHDESQGPRETTPGHLPGRYREEGARTSENEREQSGALPRLRGRCGRSPLEGSRTSPGRLDSRRLRRASRFATW